MKERKEQGITLVALMITIIVLIILAAVTIKSVYNHAIVGKATEGTEEYAKEQEREKNEIDKVASILDQITNPSGKTTLGEVYTDDMIGQKITYTSNGQSEWIVFGKDEAGNVLITTKEPVAANHEVKCTVEEWLDYEEKLNAACGGYGSTIQGKKVNSRSITMKDINYVSGVKEPEWDKYTFGTEMDYANKKVDYFYPKKGVTTTYNGEEYVNWMKATNEGEQAVLKNDAYIYGYNGGNLGSQTEDKTKQLNITGLREDKLKYIWGTEENVYDTYYVASRAVDVNSDGAHFGIAEVGSRVVRAGYALCNSSSDYTGGAGFSNSFGVRPIVVLPSDIQVIEANGIYDIAY